MGISHDKKKGHCCLLATNIILLVLSLIIILFVLIVFPKLKSPEITSICILSFLLAILLSVMAILSFGALCKGCWTYFYFILCLICLIGFLTLSIVVLIVCPLSLLYD